jgi:Fe-S-cluster containining protein
MISKKKQSKNPCTECGAICCKYVAIQIDQPTTPRDFDDIRWYIAHQEVWVFVENGDWYVCVDRRCKYLTRDNRCKIYDERPKICRKYGTADCERNGDGDPFDMKFNRPEEIEEYAREYFRQKRARARAKARRLRRR